MCPLLDPEKRRFAPISLQLNKLPAQISILALLLSSDVHRKAHLKVLKETCVPTSATESSFEDMVLTVLATNQISFTDDELPLEGREHTLPMHIMVKCEDMIVAKVLIDNGSALNVCSMSTIERLNVDTSLICPTTMIIRAFDGTLRKVQGKIELAIGIGPMFFMVNFQVIKSPSKVKINNVSFKKIGGTSSTKEAVNLICSKSVPCQQVVLSDIDLTYKGGGGSTTSTCANVQPAVSSKQNPPTCTNKH
ncbi:exopolygalacturonase clone GBGE184-like [Quercus suber]|uniref:exopolygalacturonase clone GBGE184-like n=1 Tax=Quercus suber TaxID=58331 RepID=UPI0032DFD04C